MRQGLRRGLVDPAGPGRRRRRRDADRRHLRTARLGAGAAGVPARGQRRRARRARARRCAPRCAARCAAAEHRPRLLGAPLWDRGAMPTDELLGPVAVIAGGLSHERDVSLASGRNLVRELRSARRRGPGLRLRPQPAHHPRARQGDRRRAGPARAVRRGRRDPDPARAHRPAVRRVAQRRVPAGLRQGHRARAAAPRRHPGAGQRRALGPDLPRHRRRGADGARDAPPRRARRRQALARRQRARRHRRRRPGRAALGPGRDLRLLRGRAGRALPRGRRRQRRRARDRRRRGLAGPGGDRVREGPPVRLQRPLHRRVRLAHHAPTSTTR